MNDKRWISIINLPTTVTLLGLLLSLAALYYALNGQLNLSIMVLMYAGIADLFDGLVARRCELNELERRFGVQIDTVVDVCSFVMVPVVIGYQLGLQSWFGCLILAFYCYAGAMRLAVFNTEQSTDTPITHYRGLPVTYIAFLLPLVYLISGLIWQAGVAYAVQGLYLIIAIGFIYNRLIPKPKGKVYVLAPLLVIGLSFWLMA